ncbi:MAG: transposase [Holdemanella porci]
MANKRNSLIKNLNKCSQLLFNTSRTKSKECAKNLGIGDSTLYRWKQEAKANNNQATFKGSGNLTEAELENRRLKRELKDTQDALEILKSHQHSGRITQVLYCLVSEESKVDKDFSVTESLCKLHLSKSGYYNYLHRKPSTQSISKEERMQAIQPYMMIIIKFMAHKDMERDAKERRKNITKNCRCIYARNGYQSHVTLNHM